MAKQLEVLVTGATGKQGGAVARRLLERGHKVRAFTRKVESPAARALAEKGASLYQGALDNRTALDRAAAGVDAVFSVTTPFEAGVEAEVSQGRNTADAAKAAGAYLVYTSVGSADRGTGIPHFESKRSVEDHIARIGVRAAILRPVYFMENAVTFGRDQLRQGVYATPLTPERKLAQIAVADIAAVAVLALENPARFEGKARDLAGDYVSGKEAVEVLSRVTGRRFTYYQVPMQAIRANMGEDGVRMYEFFEKTGYDVSLSALQREFSEIRWHTYEAWASSVDWKAVFGGE